MKIPFPSSMIRSASSSPSLQWLPPLFSGGLAAAGEWVQGCFRQAKESISYSVSGPEESIYLKARKNEHFARFQAWRTALERELREIGTAVVSGKLNAVELGERLLAAQASDQMAEHILSPVMYSWLLTQFEQDLRKQAKASQAHQAGANSQAITLTANIIQKTLQQLRTNLSNDPKLAEKYLCSDLFNAIILYSGDHISRDGLITILNYYQGLIDDTLRERFISLVVALPENATDPYYPLDFAKINRQIKSLLQNIQAVFDEYYDDLVNKDDDHQGVTAEALPDSQPPSYTKRFSDLLETAFGTAKDLAKQGVHFVRENPKAIITATASAAAIGATYYLSRDEGTNTPFPFDDIATPFPWGHFAPSMSQTSQILFDVTVIYGFSVASGYPRLAAPGAFITTLTNIWNGAWAAAPIVVHPIPDQIAYVGASFNMTFRWDYVFYDADNDTLSITAQQADGSPLPSWLQLRIAPFLLGSYATPEYALDVSLVGNTAFIAGRYSGLQIIDVSNPAAPFRLGFYNTPGEAHGVSIAGSTAFVADGSSLQVIDVSNSSEPFFLGVYDTPGLARGISIAGSTAFVADGSSLQVIDVSNLSAPFQLGFYNTPGSTRAVCIAGNTAFVAALSSGLQIIDVSNSSEPFFLGAYNIPGRAYGISIAGSTAFVAENGFPSSGGSLQIIDVSNPAAPFQLGFYNTSTRVLDVSLAGSMAFVAGDSSTGLLIIDVSSSSAPFLLGFYNTSTQVYDVSLAGSVAFVADSSGLQIIDVGQWFFYGTPSIPEIITINVTAKDGQGGSVTDQFRLIVSNVTFSNSVPTTSSLLSSSPSRTSTRVGSSSGRHASTGSVVTSPPNTDLFSTTTLANRQSSVPSVTRESTNNIPTIPTVTSEHEPVLSSTGGFNLLIWIIVAAAGGGALVISCASALLYAILKKRSSRKQADLSADLEGDTSSGKRGHVESHDPGVLSEEKSDEFELEEHPSTAEGNLRISAVELTKKMLLRKLIGGTYYQLSEISQKEAVEIAEETDLQIPILPGTPEIKFILGRGNFGAIKVAFNKKTGEYVASKKVKGAKAMAESMAEAVTQKAASGDNVLPIYNTIELKKALYHFMPLAGLGNGRSMQERLAMADTRLKLKALTYVAKDILTGLRTCHSKGIYHLDVKPENIVFMKDGTGYMTDFGCAKKADVSDPQVSCECIGDNRYFPPERYRACNEGIDFRADMADTWAAGLTLLELFMNQELFELLHLPRDCYERFKRCDEAFFNEQFSKIRELHKAKEGSLITVIQGLLEPDPAKRLTVTQALKTFCFTKMPNDERKATVFEQLQVAHAPSPTGSEGADASAAASASASASASGYQKTPVHPRQDFYQHESHKQYYGQFIHLIRSNAAAAAASVGEDYQNEPPAHVYDGTLPQQTFFGGQRRDESYQNQPEQEAPVGEGSFYNKTPETRPQ